MLGPAVMFRLALQPSDTLEARQGLAEPPTDEFIAGQTGNPKVELASGRLGLFCRGICRHRIQYDLPLPEIAFFRLFSTEANRRYLKHLPVNEQLFYFLKIDGRHQPSPALSRNETFSLEANQCRADRASRGPCLPFEPALRQALSRADLHIQNQAAQPLFSLLNDRH